MFARTLIAAGILFATVAAPTQASCIPATQAERLARADAVFTGRVVSVSADGASARFRVLSVRKGDLAKHEIVRVAAVPYPSSTTLRWRPREGERWQVGAQRRPGRWTTDDCLGTRRLGRG